ncbi:RNA binding protein [Rhodotorula toruloides]|uniref:Golgi apparatus membrane protein TVP23 n=1 Tax=Rhodotorula toruloides TaxID=5286 RepID=A0A511K979_RHOTO|nr:RNA binding protein [Rhodotorula toruloides]
MSYNTHSSPSNLLGTLDGQITADDESAAEEGRAGGRSPASSHLQPPPSSQGSVPVQGAGSTDGEGNIFTQSAHPVALFFLFFFRCAAIATYLLCGFFSSSYVFSTVLVVVLLSLDFWTVRNVSGRVLVGLRFWNQVDDDGTSFWVFESRSPSQPSNAVDSKMFWVAMYAFPAAWILLLFVGILKFNLSFLPIVMLALVFNVTNTVGYTYAVSASPLSPLVAPFAPSGATLGGRVMQGTGSSPWATSVAATVAGGGARDAAARVREVSWNSTASGFASAASTHSHLHRHLATLSSTSFFPGSPGASHLSPTANAAHSSSGFSSPLPQQPSHQTDSPSYPPSSHPMSESGSRDSRVAGLVDKGGYLRSAPPPGTTPLGAFLAQAGVAAAHTSHNNASGSASGTESLGAGEASEAVTTIFVVGFPDDTTEREFQNMFAFAEGFEAATLKVPAPLSALELAAQEHKEREEEAMGLLAPVPAMPGLLPHLQSTLSSVPLAREGAGTPSSMNGQPGQIQQKRQIIGFAKFRTQRQAAEAVEVLSGRRIDPERPSILKAEMAKKNLHTRKSVSSSVVLEGQGPPSRLGMGTPTTLPLPQHQQQPTPPTAVEAAAPVAAAATSAASAIAGPGGGGPSIPLSALDAGTLARLADAGNLNPAVLAEIARQKLLAAGGGGGSQSHSRSDSAYDAFHSVPVPPTTGLGSTRPPVSELHDNPASSPQTGYPPGPSSSTSSASPPQVYAAPSALAAAALGGKSMLQQLDEGLMDDPLRGGQFVYGGGGSGLHTRESSYTSYTPYVPSNAPTNGRSEQVPQTPRQAALQNPLASPPLRYPSALASIPRTQNPADMNAPKNTLYVGGLPAVLPSLTGPFSASHLEDSLRNAFSRCPGFKRLQFRNKSNGPIVFVEFVDTAHATRAMQELYGHTLGGLVKGGIRLSYSKNPLGVRSNGLPSGNPPPLQPPMSNPLDLAPSSSYGGAPLHPASSTGVGPYDSAPYDPHRRPPDPIYGESSYGTTLGGIARSPAMPHLSPLGGGPSYAAAPPPPAAAPSAHYGGSFSPFGFDG